MNSSSVKTMVELKLNKLEFQNSNRLLNTSQTIVEHKLFQLFGHFCPTFSAYTRFHP